MNTLRLLAASGLAIAAMAVHAHGKLETSEPKASSVLATAPKAIRLQFNESLEPAFSSIKLSGANNTAIPLSKVELDKNNARTMVATLPALQAGQYRVQWSTMTHDGHKTKGEFSFVVK